MRWLQAALLLSAAAFATINLQQYRPSLKLQQVPNLEAEIPQLVVNRAQGDSKFLNNRTRQFEVNGTNIPEVDFDVGESYAGLLPVDTGNDTVNKLFFWFFPSESQAADKEILIWLAGGPGCSSTGELLSENGPMLWQQGTYKPIKNKWSWHRITNVVWIDQPIGTGYSQGTPSARDQFDVARQFLGFWRNFVDTFSMHGYKVYVTGSSYSGMFCPYIASAMLDSNDKDYFNVAGMQVFDGAFSTDSITEEIPALSFVDRWENVLAFNDSFRQSLKETHEKCGYAEYMRKYLVYPPAGLQPAWPPGVDKDGKIRPECDIWSSIFGAATELTPCFSVYTVTNLCPLKFDPLGFSDAYMYKPNGSGPAYFDREDVKRAINAPVDQKWVFCARNPVFLNGTDHSVLEGPGSQPVLPNVIDRTRNVIIAHGNRDFVLIDDGTLLTIQNLTWGGQMGFQRKPTAPLYIPYHSNDNLETLAGAGVFGTVHSERGLTYLAIANAGHFIAQDAPAVAFRSVEVLLGRRDSFDSANTSFTIEPNATAPVGGLGNGTVVMFPQSMEPGRGVLSGEQTSKNGGVTVASNGQALFALGLAILATIVMGL
ncbi:putative serine carboxypeptidase-like protein 1 [Colletotrichum chlorophyti]|uniref:Putative serine carboxypeptidase-like protein 1 n=1 Tax=Colletotrichum chlorophyti TaxID=708187 RepID=A0A1Q8S7J0_9PEZI|nr:putative serine carboxypeptidase-like protein 1 [Colletotrichum chlorophyti]